MSNGFTGTTTKSMSERIVHEVESRTKHLDIFTDDFNPPGTAEIVPGQDVSKVNNNYQEKHTDGTEKGFPETQRIKREMAAAGLPKDQEPLDRIDAGEQKENAPIKKYKEQFPGSLLQKDKKMADKINGPESFHEAVEKKMAKLSKVNVGTEILVEGSYKGYVYTVFYSESMIAWEACDTAGYASSKSEAVKAAKKAIDAFILK